MFPDFNKIILYKILATMDATVGITVAFPPNANFEWDALHNGYANKSKTISLVLETI